MTHRLLTLLIADDPDNTVDNLLSISPLPVHVLDNATFDPDDAVAEFEWSDVITDSISLPHARSIAGRYAPANDPDNDDVTVVVKLNARDYMRSIDDHNTQHLVLHRTAFTDPVTGVTLGEPHQASDRLLAVTGDDVLVAYTTRLTGLER